MGSLLHTKVRSQLLQNSAAHSSPKWRSGSQTDWPLPGPLESTPNAADSAKVASFLPLEICILLVVAQPAHKTCAEKVPVIGGHHCVHKTCAEEVPVLLCLTKTPDWSIKS